MIPNAVLLRKIGFVDLCMFLDFGRANDVCPAHLREGTQANHTFVKSFF